MGISQNMGISKISGVNTREQASYIQGYVMGNRYDKNTGKEFCLVGVTVKDQRLDEQKDSRLQLVVDIKDTRPVKCALNGHKQTVSTWDKRI